MRQRTLVLGVLAGWALSAALAVSAQQPPKAAASEPKSAKAAANVDLTGWWVAYVTEDWRWRMVTPPKFDYSSVPLNHEGLRVADTWDWQKDQAAGLQCKAYGAAGLMRIPTRVHISWQDESTLKVETDAGTQVRLFSFGGKPYVPGADRTWQGVSVAEWEPTGVQATSQQILSIPPAPPSYALKVMTTGLRAGYLRSNGVPYGEGTTLTEYYDTLTHSSGQDWLLITTVVDDPQYLQQPFITTTHFKREADGSRWHPTACEITPPPREARPVPPNGYLPKGTH